MDQRQHFLMVIDYEKWANDLWLDFLANAPNHPQGGQFAAKADEIMSHIIGCYYHWFHLMAGSTTELTGDSRTDMATQHATMKEFTSACDLQSKLRRTWAEHGTYEWSLYQVIQHALCHGSYHRGQIRALAEHYGFEDWPDTDFEAFSGMKIG